MKLYTEEQMRVAYNLGFSDSKNYFGRDECKKEDETINFFTPIELPSDEEIEEKEAEKRFPYEKHMGDTWGNGLHEGFIIGAEWIKEQILNQNK